MKTAACRFCGSHLSAVMADLGMSPMANAFLPEEELDRPETFYPLRAMVCGLCFLVQVEEYATPEAIFGDYAYFSSYSKSWLEHSQRLSRQMIRDLSLDDSSFVIEVASNDGYLLQFFQRERIPVLGIEPARNVAKAAQAAGVPTRMAFFGEQLARELAEDRRPDLIIGNNVLAHVPDLNDFVSGLKTLLAPGGTITIEIPHLLRLMQERQFDTIYHEHFSYFSLSTLRVIFGDHGLRVIDVEELPTHGGSLRIYLAHDDDSRSPSGRVGELVNREAQEGLLDLATYERFSEAIRGVKREILAFFISQKDVGVRIAAYGAPAKGNTLLNYCGIGLDFIDFTVDRNPHKQGLFLPGTHIPVLEPEALSRYRPDLVFILPWNLRDEIMPDLSYVRGWGGRFVVRSPDLNVVE